MTKVLVGVSLALAVLVGTPALQRVSGNARRTDADNARRMEADYKIVRVRGLKSLSKEEQRWLRRVSMAHPSWGRRPRVVFEVKQLFQMNYVHPQTVTLIVAPGSRELNRGVKVVSIGHWSAAMQSMKLDTKGRVSHASSLEATQLFVPVNALRSKH